MLDSENKLTPDSKYIILNPSANQNVNRSVLTNLYLPIIGRGAVDLYDLLWSLSISDHNKLKLHKHFELQSMLDVGIDKLLQYRRKLEAVNLLTTSISLTSADSYVYSLKKPSSATEFLKTDVLSILLLGKVGEETYRRIVARLFIPTPNVGKVRNVSASILDIFQIPRKSFKNIPGPVNTVKRTITENRAQIAAQNLMPSSDEFDFNLLLDILHNSYVDLNSVEKNRSLILSEYALYGMDELKMGELVEKATNLNTNKLNPKSLKFIINREYTQPDIKGRAIQNVTAKKESKPDPQIADLLKDPGLQAVLQSAKENAPIAFLKMIKDRRGGIVSSNEAWAVSNLVSKGLFSKEVINTLIYYVLVDLGKTALNQNLFNTIADRWAQKGVSDAESALLEIKKYQDEREQKSQSVQQSSPRKYGSGPRRRMVEELPDWAKKQKQEDEQAAKEAEEAAKETKAPDAAERKRVNEALARIRKRKQQGGGA